ncbi:DUF3305 domain-containing protein [Paracoccus methylarcula]|uniref:DUF3305 domain-containing protein n=1 Tax=Paracoccus methylarcula TaxID=72022 RepID=A0A422QXT6_9RHOB|nr:DUF3305 domain-containing protein [Paracoccus methylarcula]RNF34798.1 DUF3305 domain-containing protein [Paracoccus methylarcula]
MPLGIVLRRTPGVTRWARWSWKAVAVLPGAGSADWRELRRDGDVIEYHAATRTLELYAAETEAYMHGLAARIPSVYVVMRPVLGQHPFDILLVTASPFEAQDYSDSAEDIVEKVPMTPGLVAWVGEFVDLFHRGESFVKRQRDKRRVDLRQDGIGDPRIGKAADVYASPRLMRSRLS